MVVWVVVVHVGLMVVLVPMVMVIVTMVMVVDQVLPVVMDHISIMPKVSCRTVMPVPSFLQRI